EVSTPGPNTGGSTTSSTRQARWPCRCVRLAVTTRGFLGFGGSTCPKRWQSIAVWRRGMPVRKRKDRRRHAVPDWKTEIDLDIGWLSDRSDDEMRAAWETYRDYMMALPRPAGTRP